jgi:polar amino acid transport system permease protein
VGHAQRQLDLLNVHASLFQPALLAQYLVSADFFHGALMTLWLSIASLAVGLVIGLLLAVGQEAPWSPVRTLVWAYIWLFRGTPVLLQLVFAFNVLPAFGILLPGFTCAVLALGLNEGAYMAEIMRSGIRAVGPGQRLAARALGLEDAKVMRWVVLPQALRIVIPPIGNQFIGMLKLSALVSVIGVKELLLVADETASGNFRYIETLTAAGIYYLVLTTVFMVIQSAIERSLRRRKLTARRTTAVLEMQPEVIR